MRKFLLSSKVGTISGELQIIRQFCYTIRPSATLGRKFTLSVYPSSLKSNIHCVPIFYVKQAASVQKKKS